MKVRQLLCRSIIASTVFFSIPVFSLTTELGDIPDDVTTLKFQEKIKVSFRETPTSIRATAGRKTAYISVRLIEHIHTLIKLQQPPPLANLTIAYIPVAIAMLQVLHGQNVPLVNQSLTITNITYENTSINLHISGINSSGTAVNTIQTLAVSQPGEISVHTQTGTIIPTTFKIQLFPDTFPGAITLGPATGASKLSH